MENLRGGQADLENTKYVPHMDAKNGARDQQIASKDQQKDTQNGARDQQIASKDQQKGVHEPVKGPPGYQKTAKETKEVTAGSHEEAKWGHRRPLVTKR